MVADLLYRMKKHPVLDVVCFSDGCILKKRVPHSSSGGFTYGTVNKKGYLVTSMGGKQYRVHRLIAEAFLPNPDGKPTVDHIDRNPLNNELSNLRWADMSEQKNNSSLVIERLRLGVRQSENSQEYNRRWREYAKNSIYMWVPIRKWKSSHRDETRKHWDDVKRHCKECNGRRIKE